MTGRSRKMLATLVASIALLVVPSLAAGQQDGPTEVARQVFAALRDRRWSELPAHVDSVALVEFRRQQLQRVWGMDRAASRPRVVNPDFPPCVAEYFERQRPRPASPDLRRQLLLGAGSAEELEKLTPAEMLVRWLESREAAMSGARRDSASPPLPTVPRTERTVVGAVLDGDTTAYVVNRIRMFFGSVSPGPDQVGLLRLVRRGSQWKVASPNQLIEWGGEVIATGIVGQTEMLRLRIGPR